MEKKLDLRPTLEESCSQSVIRFYHDFIETIPGRVWLVLLLKDMYLYSDHNELTSRYLARITLLIDHYLESGIDSTLAEVVR